MDYLQRSAASRGTTIAYNCLVAAVARDGDGYAVEIDDADGEHLTLRAAAVINAAGLHADEIARTMGIDCEKAGYRIRPCKGEYFKVADRHRGKLHRLVYPVPTAVHLGAHAVLGLDGGLKLGPSSFYVDSLDYAVDAAHASDFHAKASRFLPFLSREDLTPDMSGSGRSSTAKGNPSVISSSGRKATVDCPVP